METTLRNRAWRRTQNSLFKAKDLKGKKTTSLKSTWKDCIQVKRWKDMFIRSEKIKRAKQLGFEYPVISKSQRLLMSRDEYKGKSL
jgi:CRISPR/Cas system-associated endoribonuclease Cas2